jgi:hypothetical protein
MGDFGVPLRPRSHWGGSKALRERWTTHIKGILIRLVLLI